MERGLERLSASYHGLHFKEARRWRESRLDVSQENSPLEPAHSVLEWLGGPALVETE